MNRHSQNGRPGVALIAVIVLLLVGNLVIAGLVMTGGGDQEMTVRQVESAKALSAAEAGTQMAIRELIIGVDEDGDGVVGSISDDGNDANNPSLGNAQLMVSMSTGSGTTTLVSTGCAGIAKRRIEAVYNITPASTSIPGVAVSGLIEIDGDNQDNDAFVDGYDSSLGSYGDSNKQLEVTLVTNSTSNNKIKVNDGTIYGNVRVGVDANPDDVISISSDGVITGTTGTIDGEVGLYSWNPPSMGNDVGDFKKSSGTSIWNSDTCYNKIELKGSAVVVVDGDITIKVQGTFEIKDSAQIQVNPGSSLTIYAEQKIDMEDSASINANTEQPSQVKIFCDGSGHFTMLDDSQCHALVYMAGTNHRMKVSDNAQFFGAFVGPELLVSEHGQFHIDLASVDQIGIESVGSGDNKYRLSSWQEVNPN